MVTDWPKTVQKEVSRRKEKETLEPETECELTEEEFKAARKKLQLNLIESMKKFQEGKEDESSLHGNSIYECSPRHRSQFTHMGANR